MKYKVFYAALAVFVLLVVTDARKTSGSRNRGGSSGSRTPSRGKVNYPPSAPPAPSGGLSHSRPASGYGFSQSNPAPKPAESRPVGWQVNNKETAVRKDVAGTQHAAYPAASNGLSGSGTAQGSHGYPSSGGLSGNSPSNQQSPVQQSHSYPSNAQPGQQSGANTNLHALSYPSNNQQSHTYPNSGGLSGHSGSAPPGYPAQTGGGSPAYPGSQGTHQGAASAYPGQQGIHQPPAYPGGANNHPSGYPGQAGAAYPVNNVGHSSYPQQAPVYPGYGGVGNGYSGGYGGVGGGYGGGYGGPGGFGGYNAYGGGNRGSSALTGLGIAGAGAGTLLTGLALWNLARSTNGGSRHTQHNVYNTYNTYNETHTGPGGVPIPVNPNAPAIDPVLGELVNCTLTVSATNATEVLAIPCGIATSVASANHEKLAEGSGAETKCIVTVVNKNGTEFMTSIPCSTLTGLAAKAEAESPFPQPTSNCTLPAGLTPDPINPCMPLEGNMTVIPLPQPTPPQDSTASATVPALDSSPAPTTAPAA